MIAGVNLLPGDVFCVYGNMAIISPIIRGTQKFWSSDNDARYGHSGIITSENGDTFEALWTVRASTLKSYVGQRILITRPCINIFSDEPITHTDKLMGIAVVKRYSGRIYPFWRLPLFLFPPAAKYLTLGEWLVCSELVSRYLVSIQARCKPFTGVNPDNLADEWVKWRNFDVLYEGVWE